MNLYPNSGGFIQEGVYADPLREAWSAAARAAASAARRSRGRGGSLFSQAKAAIRSVWQGRTTSWRPKRRGAGATRQVFGDITPKRSRTRRAKTTTKRKSSKVVRFRKRRMAA